MVFLEELGATGNKVCCPLLHAMLTISVVWLLVLMWLPLKPCLRPLPCHVSLWQMLGACVKTQSTHLGLMEITAMHDMPSQEWKKLGFFVYLIEYKSKDIGLPLQKHSHTEKLSSLALSFPVSFPSFSTKSIRSYIPSFGAYIVSCSFHSLRLLLYTHISYSIWSW